MCSGSSCEAQHSLMARCGAWWMVQHVILWVTAHSVPEKMQTLLPLVLLLLLVACIGPRLTPQLCQCVQGDHSASMAVTKASNPGA